MATFFSTAPGSVIRVDDGRQAIPFRINLPGFPSGAAIVTAAAMQHQGNVQFLHTVEDFIYVYVFGDRIGTLSVEGAVFMNQCSGQQSGMDAVLGFYGQNRVAAKASPVRVGFGMVPFNSFLIGGNFRAAENGDAGAVGQFVFNFNAFPH